MKKSKIDVQVSLDDHNHPVEIEWSATDSGVEGLRKCKCMNLSFWDGDDQCTYRIDLWTQGMMVEEMQHMMYETFRGMAETYKKATGDDDVTSKIQEFAQVFGKMTSVLK